MSRAYPVVTISKHGSDRMKNGHPWVFDNEVKNILGTYANGDIVDVRSEKGKYIGTGFINDHSKIIVRLLSRNANDTFDNEFFKRRVQYAYDYRKTVMQGEDIKCCRIIFGEADFLPGVTVDRFNEFLVVQIATLGMELRKDAFLQPLLEYMKADGQDIRCIYMRNDLSVRKLEGLEEEKGIYYNDPLHPVTSLTTTIVENGISYYVDVENGQKTGFFLDQKFNRAAVSRIAKDKHILDCFTHTGSFGLNAAKGGAAHVLSVDISKEAIEMAKKNAERNNLKNIDFEVWDVFELLKKKVEEHSKEYDFIILDPPAFTKSRKTINNAFMGYKEINKLAMKLLPRGGYLATCSCSHFMSEKMFMDMLKEASKECNVQLRQIECRQQACDHPILYHVEETNYLKFFIFQIV